MRTRDDVTADKLRGGFYSPDELVDLCFDRVADLTSGREELALLEPSAGDGAFVRGVARHPAMSQRVASVTAVELLPAEAAKCTEEMNRLDLIGQVHVQSAIKWATRADTQYDIGVGNPPFVRFQFVAPDDKASSQRLERQLGVSFAGVSNLWLPVLVGALSHLRIGGVFAFIVPAECFTGISAGTLREWLVRNTSELRFDLFPPGSFPLVLQEVVVMSGRRCPPLAGSGTCTLYEHSADGVVLLAAHQIPPGTHPWTRYLLTKEQADAFDEARRLGDVWALSDVAKFEVAAVTGANDFFSVDTATLEQFGLAEWSVPLLPRIRHAPGLRYASSDHAAAESTGAKTHLLDFSSERPDPASFDGPSEYLSAGVAEGLHERYKCRIRTPWYRVPFIRTGRLMMSKRSHRHPRVVMNECGAVTTDTIYRGSMVGFFGGREEDLVAAFHNSLTLLSAEVEGRSFGGGVLELVPSEVGRLVVPMPTGFSAELDRLDAIARSTPTDDAEGVLIYETDVLLIKADIGFTPRLVDALRSGREALMSRRLDRNAS